MRDDCPHNIEVHRVVPVDNAITEAYHLGPGKLWILGSNVARDTVRSLPNDFQQPNKCEAEDPIVGKFDSSLVA